MVASGSRKASSIRRTTCGGRRAPGLGTNAISNLQIPKLFIIRLTYFSIRSCGYGVNRDLVIMVHVRRGSRRGFLVFGKKSELKLVSHIAV